MKPRLHIADLLILLVAIGPLLYLGYVYQGLPAKVPTHFGMDGVPNDYSSRQSLWIISACMAAGSVLMFLLFRFLPLIDPKKTARYSAAVFNKIAVATALFISAINVLVVYAAQKGSLSFASAMPLLLGVFFSFMGNIMHSIKPNYFAGIRTPWTLESEETWRQTHQLAGKLWFVGGIVVVITGLLIPANIEPYVMMGCLFVMAIIPVVYSYIFFKALQKKQ
jgi:uncharacterized membrane protein